MTRLRQPRSASATLTVLALSAIALLSSSTNHEQQQQKQPQQFSNDAIEHRKTLLLRSPEQSPRQQQAQQESSLTEEGSVDGDRSSSTVPSSSQVPLHSSTIETTEEGIAARIATSNAEGDGDHRNDGDSEKAATPTPAPVKTISPTSSSSIISKLAVESVERNGNTFVDVYPVYRKHEGPGPPGIRTHRVPRADDYRVWYAAFTSSNTTTAHERKTPTDLVPSVTSQIQRGLDRFLAINGGVKEFSRSDCLQAAERCGRACGDILEPFFTACFCLRIDPQGLVTYAGKPEHKFKDGEEFALDWKNLVFQHLMTTLNLVQTAVHEIQLQPPDPMYLVVSVFDYPRLFTMLDMNTTQNPAIPRITQYHYSEGTQWSFFEHQAYRGGVPDYEPCRAKLQQARSDNGKSAEHGHFPILSWSVHPKFNFDLVVPHQHGGDCHEQVLKDEIAQVPWKEKSDTLVFRGSINGCSFEYNDHFAQRGRFCGRVHMPDVQEYAQQRNLTIDVEREPHIPPMEQAKFKYIVLVDGASAAFRSTWYLATGSVLFSAAALEDVRTQFLIPFVHYVPVKPDFSDFLEKLDLVVSDPNYAEWVAENARAVGQLTSLDGEGHNDGGYTFDKLYWKELLRLYQQTFTFVQDRTKTNRTTTDVFMEERSCHTFVNSNHCFDSRIDFACNDTLQDGRALFPNMRQIPNKEWRRIQSTIAL